MSCFWLPTDPNILGLTQTFLKTFEILMSNFRLFLRIFILFPCKKVFIKKKVCLTTNTKNLGPVTGNMTYFIWPKTVIFFLMTVQCGCAVLRPNKKNTCVKGNLTLPKCTGETPDSF